MLKDQVSNPLTEPLLDKGKTSFALLYKSQTIKQLTTKLKLHLSKAQ